MKITNEIREAFVAPEEVRKAIDAANANLMHGPGHGSFSRETLETIREWFYSLPADIFYNRSTGEIETSPEEDVMPWCDEISTNALKNALFGEELAPYI